MAITSAFQADDAGSIPAARSNVFPLYRIFQHIENIALYCVIVCIRLLFTALFLSSSNSVETKLRPC